MSQLRLTKHHKFNARAVTIDGHRFPSLAEGRRYSELKMLERAGEIRNLTLQPWFVLMAPVLKDGLQAINAGTFERVTPIGRYTADFRYERREGGLWRLVVEDVKASATRTEAYRLRKRHVEAQYQIEIVEIGRPEKGR